MDGMNFSDGWRDSRSGARYDREDPAHTATVVASFPESDAEDVDHAVRAVADAPTTWGRLGAHERRGVLDRAAGLLRERASAIGDDLSAEEGKPVAEARGEVLRAADVFAYVASSADRECGQVFGSQRPGVTLMTQQRPLGVVAAITPFNFPAFVSSGKIAAALMAGDGVVWKPSPLTPMTGAHVVTALLDAGLPNDVLAYLTGTSAGLGEYLVSHPGIDAVTFTGSSRVGALVEVAAARGAKRAQVEKGGNNPLVAAADADVERVVTAVLEGAFGGTGQKCTATGRLVVARALHDDVVDALRAGALDVVVGPGSDPDTRMGPIVSLPAQQSYERSLAAAEAAGADVFRGGRLPDDPSGGYFVRPAIVTGVDPGDDIARDEVFGPCVTVLPFDDFEDAITIANGTPYGLSAALFSDSLHTTEAFLASVRAGTLAVNVPTTGVEAHVPFGGLKDSGSGPREWGPDALSFYSAESTVAVAAGR